MGVARGLHHRCIYYYSELVCLYYNVSLVDMTTLWEHPFPQLNLYPVSKESFECTGFEESIKECEFIEVMETATSQDSLLSVNCTGKSICMQYTLYKKNICFNVLCRIHSSPVYQW